MRTSLWLGITATLILGGGCKDDIDGLRDAEGSMEPLVEAACGWMFGCCSDGERTFQLGEFTPDASNCTVRLIDAIKAGHPLSLVEPGLSSTRAEGLLLLARSINEGRVSVNDAAVRACADDTAGRACNAPLEGDTGRCTPGDVALVDPCDPDEMFRGQQGVGDECDAAWECQDGLRCVNFFVTGVCAAAAAVGEHCFSDGECATDLVCDYDSGTCIVGAGVGEPCAYRDPANPVPGTEDTRCAADLVCDPSSSTCSGGFCTTGAPCFDTFAHSDCPEGTWCVGEDAAQRSCRPPGAIGAPCLTDETCESNHCDPIEQVCGTRLADGQPCVIDSECASDYCEGSCAPTVPVGELCPSFRDAQCDGGYCDTTAFDATCMAYAGEGQPCPFGFECDPEHDLACIDGSCQTYPLPNGLPCGSNAQCASNVCFGGMCTDGTPAGGACDMGGATTPCELGTFCDIPEGDTAGACAVLRRTGQACERSEQCWGDCTVRYGRQMCDETPAYALDEVWCGGA